MHSIGAVCLFAFLGVVNIADAAPVIDINQNPADPATGELIDFVHCNCKGLTLNGLINKVVKLFGTIWHTLKCDELH